MVEAVLFDLDGVLIDSEEFSSQASKEILEGVEIIQTPEEKRKVFGRRTIDNYRDAIEARDLDIDPEELMHRKNRLFAKIIRGKLAPLPGAVELLRHLKDAGVKVAVVSSSPLERVNVSLEEVGLLTEFDFIVSGDCCQRGKPHPEPFLIAAEKFDAVPGECIVFEDAQAGIESGKAAGMKVVAVKSPNTHGQDLSLADAVVDSLEDVGLDFLRRL